MDVMTIGFSIVAMLVSSAIHEYAHAVTAHWLGDDTAKAEGRMTLNPIAHIDPIGLFMMVFGRIGWSKPVPVNHYNFEKPAMGNAIVAIAGPISNLIMTAICAGILKIIADNVVSTPLTAGITLFFIIMVYVNVSLMLFNLIPIPPLDGSNIVDAFLPKKWQEPWMDLGQYAPILLLILALPISPAFTIFRDVWYNLLVTVITWVFQLFGVPFSP